MLFLKNNLYPLLIYRNFLQYFVVFSFCLAVGLCLVFWQVVNLVMPNKFVKENVILTNIFNVRGGFCHGKLKWGRALGWRVFCPTFVMTSARTARLQCEIRIIIYSSDFYSSIVRCLFIIVLLCTEAVSETYSRVPAHLSNYVD